MMRLPRAWVTDASSYYYPSCYAPTSTVPPGCSQQFAQCIAVTRGTRRSGLNSTRRAAAMQATPIRRARYPAAAARRSWVAQRQPQWTCRCRRLVSRLASTPHRPRCHTTRPALVGACAHAFAHILRNRAAKLPIRALLEALVCARVRECKQGSCQLPPVSLVL